MKIERITEQDLVQLVKDDATVLIVQKETKDGEEVESLRRTSLQELINALKRNGISPDYFEIKDGAVCAVFEEEEE